MSVKAQENCQQRPQDSSPDSNNNDATTADRLQFLEKEYRQLSALFQYISDRQYGTFGTDPFVVLS